jgi:Ca-activated chloride channel family protein
MRGLIFLVLAAVATPRAQPPIFTVQTELVRIDVLVERNGKPVVGLTANDFAVEDEGVPQRVSLLRETESVTVSTILDVSGSMTPQKLSNAGAGIRAMMAALHGRDRHALYAFAGDIRQVALPRVPDSLTAESFARALRETGGAHTSLCDALFAAIVQSDVASGPKMAAVMTDGRNNTSWLSAQSVIDAAIRHETVIYPVAVGQDPPQYRFELPPLAGDDGLRLLQVIADRTGGRVIHADWSRDLGPVFDSLVREYRQRYILSFTPERVGRGDGWHRLEVGLRNRAGKVHARSGYWSR